ncbi:MAG TPA: type IV CRISPR-associated protein Csf2 [Rhodocyclaceae bacterium]|nr:type IV CRISPR-associated protein Csf2 [Rhodocyclaceae bacterium]
MANQQKSISIRGVITLTAHAHQTAPDGGAEGVTPQMKTGVFCEGKKVDVPYISANSVRGMIRRAAGDVLMEQIEARGEQISRNVYLSIKRGSYARTGLDAGGATYMQMVAADKHPFAGLFGGGAHMYRSKLRIERDLYPMIASTRSLFPERYQAMCVEAEPAQLLTKTLIASRDDFERLPAGAFIENVEQAYLEHMAAKFGQNAAKKAQKAEARAEGQGVVKSEKLKTDDLNTFTQVECIVAGTPMYFGVTVSAPTDAQIGLLLNAIQRWANANALGGGSCRGRGSFKAALQLFSGSELLIENVLTGDAGSYELAAKAAPYVAALEEAITEGMAEAATLSALYPTAIKKDDDETKGKKGKAKAAEAEAEA